jgi:hypothetical protein
LDGLAEQGLHTFIALFAGMHSVCRQSFQVVATVIGKRGVVVNERVVLLIREIPDAIVQCLDFAVSYDFIVAHRKIAQIPLPQIEHNLTSMADRK